MVASTAAVAASAPMPITMGMVLNALHKSQLLEKFEKMDFVSSVHTNYRSSSDGYISRHAYDMEEVYADDKLLEDKDDIARVMAMPFDQKYIDVMISVSYDQVRVFTPGYLAAMKETVDALGEIVEYDDDEMDTFDTDAWNFDQTTLCLTIPARLPLKKFME
jgi:hypothetical protein